MVLPFFSCFKRLQFLVNESYLSAHNVDVTQYLIGSFDNFLRGLKPKSVD